MTKTFSEILSFKETNKFKELEEKIKQKNKEIQELWTQLNRECPIGPDRTWALSLSDEVVSCSLQYDCNCWD
jgi:hypothetical protein